MNDPSLDEWTEPVGMEITTYDELYGNLVLNGEIIITVLPEEVEKLKVGLKNLKAKQNKKLKDDGLVIDSSTLNFIILPSKEHEGAIDIHVSLIKKAVVPILGIRVPDKEF